MDLACPRKVASLKTNLSTRSASLGKTQASPMPVAFAEQNSSSVAPEASIRWQRMQGWIRVG